MSDEVRDWSDEELADELEATAPGLHPDCPCDWCRAVPEAARRLRRGTDREAAIHAISDAIVDHTTELLTEGQVREQARGYLRDALQAIEEAHDE